MSGDNLAIVGGGITGLMTAYYAVQNGYNPEDITVYESSNRFGGQIRNEQLANGLTVNRAAEFIDKEHTKLIEIAKELGVPLTKADDQAQYSFQVSGDKKMEADKFFSAYKPIFERIQQDKQEVTRNPKGELAKKLNNISAKAYLEELGEAVEIAENRGFFKKVYDFIALNNNHVDPAILSIAENAFASEVGQPASKASALQFVHESSNQFGDMFNSGCDYRVEGGTEQLIVKLQEKLAEKGVKFSTASTVKNVKKDDDGSLNLTFESGKESRHGKIVFALPAYDLARIDGMEALGLADKDKKLMSDLQYSNVIKVTVNTKIDVPAENLYSENGFQSWSSKPKSVTFLIANDGNLDTGQRINDVLASYAKANGSDIAQMFGNDYMQAGNISVNRATARPCYASPATGQAMELENLDISLARLSANNIGIAGTFLPQRTKNGVALGFMNNGAESAVEVVRDLLSEKDVAMQRMLGRQRGLASNKAADILI